MGNVGITTARLDSEKSRDFNGGHVKAHTGNVGYHVGCKKCFTNYKCEINLPIWLVKTISILLVHIK